MTPTEVFITFVTRTLEPHKARRFTALTTSAKGHRKLLDALCHEFEPAIRPASIAPRNYDTVLEKPCYAFHQRLGFGVPFSTVREAYDALEKGDSWLIILQDASAGIHRPEWRWDGEKLIVS